MPLQLNLFSLLTIFDITMFDVIIEVFLEGAGTVFLVVLFLYSDSVACRV